MKKVFFAVAIILVSLMACAPKADDSAVVANDSISVDSIANDSTAKDSIVIDIVEVKK
jgi:hypothetical protein